MSQLAGPAALQQGPSALPTALALAEQRAAALARLGLAEEPIPELDGEIGPGLSVPGLPWPSHKQLALRERVRAWALEQIAPLVPQLRAAAYNRRIAELIAAQGYIGATIPARYQGMGVGHIGKTIILEELSRVSPAAGAVAQASMLGTAMLLHYGTEEQRARWLPQIASGGLLPTIAVTEPDTGGHVLGTSTSAVRDGDHYILTGRKCLVGNSHVGHLQGVLTRTGPGSGGLTAFWVPADTPGLHLPEHPRMCGLEGFSFGEVVLDGCRVPVSHRIGGEGDGLAVAYSSSVLYGRANLAAVALGLHWLVLQEAIGFARTRQHKGKPLTTLPTIRTVIAEMYSRLLTARTLLYAAAAARDAGEACDELFMTAKLVGVRAVRASVADARTILAGHGLTADAPIAGFADDAECLEPPAGTSAIQLKRLAEVALGEDRRDRRRPWSLTIPPEGP